MTRTNHLRALTILMAMVLAASLLVLAKPAEAAFPGQNGKIAFECERDGNREVYAMNPSGSNQTRLTNNPAFDGRLLARQQEDSVRK